MKTGTIFENTKIPLTKLFLAIWLLCSHKKGISSLQLARDIDVTQKTAWIIMQKIRYAMADINEFLLSGVIEIDETFCGGLNKNRHWDKKVPHSQGRSFKDKTPVFGMLERGGKVVLKVVPDTKAETLSNVIYNYVQTGSTIHSDEWNYGDLSVSYTHENIHHNIKQYANGNVTTNRIENVWSVVKRGIIGIYHYTSRKHLQKYMDEFAFRRNSPSSNSERFNLLLCNSNKRITYKQLISC